MFRLFLRGLSSSNFKSFESNDYLNTTSGARARPQSVSTAPSHFSRMCLDKHAANIATTAYTSLLTTPTSKLFVETMYTRSTKRSSARSLISSLLHADSARCA